MPGAVFRLDLRASRIPIAPRRQQRRCAWLQCCAFVFRVPESTRLCCPPGSCFVVGSSARGCFRRSLLESGARRRRQLTARDVSTHERVTSSQVLGMRGKRARWQLPGHLARCPTVNPSAVRRLPSAHFIINAACAAVCMRLSACHSFRRAIFAPLCTRSRARLTSKHFESRQWTVCFMRVPTSPAPLWRHWDRSTREGTSPLIFFSFGSAYVRGSVPFGKTSPGHSRMFPFLYPLSALMAMASAGG